MADSDSSEEDMARRERIKEILQNIRSAKKKVPKKATKKIGDEETQEQKPERNVKQIVPLEVLNPDMNVKQIGYLEVQNSELNVEQNVPSEVLNPKQKMKQIRPLEVQNPEQNVKQMGHSEIQNPKQNAEQNLRLEVENPKQNVKQIVPLEIQNPEQNVEQIVPLVVQNSEQIVKQIGYLEVHNPEQNVEQIVPLVVQNPEQNVKQMGHLEVQNNEQDVEQIMSLEVEHPEKNVKQMGHLVVQNPEQKVEQIVLLEEQNPEQNVKQMGTLVVQNNKGNVKQMGPIEIQSPEKNVKQMGPLVVQNNKGNVKQMGPIEIQIPEQNVKQIGPLMVQNNEGNVKQMGPLEIQNHEQNVKQLGFEEVQDQEPSVKHSGSLEVHDIEKNVYSDSCVTELLGKKIENQGVQVDIGKSEPPSKKIKTKSSDELHVDHLNIPFENFELLEKIGEGGFGEVHRGNYLGTNIAVKKLKLKRMKLVKQSVLREVEINSHIRHPNIVLLMGYSINADHLYILTELIQGPNLDDLLFGEEGHTLQMSQKHLIAQQVTQGIAYLHNRNPVIVHRDIKPENILLSPNFDTAKVCDLGLSKLKTMNTMHSTIFQKNEMQPGTPAYQAPEILVDLLSAKPPSDIWSMSCTFTELYTEKEIWNTTDMDVDGATSIETIANAMRRKEVPHGLVRLNTQDMVPCNVRKFIADGLQYEISLRPTAIHFCSVFREVTWKLKNSNDGND